MCKISIWFAWATPTNLAQIHVMTIRNWTRYYTICTYFKTFQILWLTNIMHPKEIAQATNAGSHISYVHTWNYKILISSSRM